VTGVAESLERLGARGVDPTAEVYARVFARWPETERLFFRDHDRAIRGHMLFEVIEAVLDMAGEGHYARGLIATERVHHIDDLQVTEEQYLGFFAILRDVVCERLGSEWTGEMAAAWDALLNKVAERP
jgi:hemoglobin-like flavoprotein